MGLGGYPAVTLKKARAAAALARAQVVAGLNPIEARKVLSETPTFGQVADGVVEVRSKGMKNAKAIYRLKRALEIHAKALRRLPVDEVRTDDIVKVLNLIWTQTPEAAGKVRGYIEMVLDAARAKGHRTGDNPARWRGHLDQLMAKRAKLVRGHHAALPFQEVPAFVADLKKRQGSAARGLEFAILTAARSGEVFGARWSDIDLTAKLWTILGVRMKSGKEHRVPLSGRAMKILAEVSALKIGKDDRPVFPGQSRGAQLSTMAFAMLMRRMGRKDLTVHGFRSSFRDWCGEATNFPREVAEAALAHAVGDDVERAYRRGDALEKRRKLMEAWAGFVGRGVDLKGNVRPFRAAA
jgi:integrase